jgi:hypothetical protein
MSSRSRSYRALWLALSISFATPAAHAYADADTALPASGSAPRPSLFGARAGIEGAPTLALFYARFGRGIWQEPAETELALESAFLTGFRGWAVKLERREPLWRCDEYALTALLGTGLGWAGDRGGTYRGWTGVFGLQATRALGSWELGLRLAYLPTFVTHLDFSDEMRDTFRDRYPDAREQPGPASATLWLAGQRLHALLKARKLWDTWAFEAALGLDWSPLAGRQWTNLEQGQLPLTLGVGIARRF